MRPTVRPVLLVTAAVGAALLGAGCSTTVTGQAAPEGATAAAPSASVSGDAVGWVDTVCGSLSPFIEVASAPPQLDGSGDPATLVQGLGDYFGSTAAAADTAVEGMKAAGPSPVAGGDELVTRLSDALGKVGTSFRDAATRVDAIDTSDPAALATALPEAVAPLQEVAALPDPASDLAGSPELDAASKQAANCQKVETLTGG